MNALLRTSLLPAPLPLLAKAPLFACSGDKPGPRDAELRHDGGDGPGAGERGALAERQVGIAKNGEVVDTADAEIG